jgi:hypothetical protein
VNSAGNQRTVNDDALARKRAIARWENEGGKVLTESSKPGEVLQLRPEIDPRGSRSGIIRMHLRKLEQLFDSLDHSPFREKDLDRNAEEYIVDSIKELPAETRCEILIYLDEPIDLGTQSNAVTEAIHVHFARRAQVARQNLRQLLRRGSISLAIGLSFLITFSLLGQVIQQTMGEGQWAFLMRESLLIGGWVAMWKPLEVFLYDWWPIVGEGRLYERLSRIKVQIIH